MKFLNSNIPITKNIPLKTLGSRVISLNVIASITTVLVIFGFCATFALYTQKLAIIIKENIEIYVYLDKDLSKEDRDIIHSLLANKNYIQQKDGYAQVTFEPKEKTAKELIKETGENFIQFLGENPLRDAFIIKIKEEFFETTALLNIKKDLQKVKGIYEVVYQENLIQTMNQNVWTLSSILLGFGLLMLLTAIILIDNTIKIAIFSQRMLIRSMQLVGATNAFIRRPFLSQALLQGIFSGLLASLLLFFMTNYLQLQMEELALLYDLNGFLALAVGLTSLGGLISVLSTYNATQKYLRVSLEDLY